MFVPVTLNVTARASLGAAHKTTAANAAAAIALDFMTRSPKPHRTRELLPPLRPEGVTE
jgi:hypothetical protein